VADVVIIDYGAGNVRSTWNALERVLEGSARLVLSSDAAAIRGAARVVLPGVGAFGECKKKMEERGVLEPLFAAVGRGTPFLGICVGMQMLATEGLEFGSTPGFGWVPGVTRRIDVKDGRKLPHIGWAPLEARPHALFEGIARDASFYFVHSFFLDAAQDSHIAARVTYGATFTAAVAKDNVFGVQFHPEKSDRAGLALLANFCRWRP
jgi:imidazole glycerol-phosphate synthase subunit HisH